MSRLKDLLDIHIIHFSKLVERKSSLAKQLPTSLNSWWVTEHSVDMNLSNFVNGDKVFGVTPRKIGMDLGINSRSLSRSRRKAKYEGYFLLLRSFLDKRGESLVASQIETRARQKVPILENLHQHLFAIKQASNSEKQFHLIIEDDALPTESAWLNLENMILSIKKRDRFIAFLGSGADLVRTSSDKKIDAFGLYNTHTFCTRTAVATLYSRDVCQDICKLIEKYGIPDWMPIDYLLQVATRKLKIKTFWQDPPLFRQGSEIGVFKSSLR
jgi:hypothetical protein